MRWASMLALLMAAQDPGVEHTKDTLDMVKAKLSAKDAVLVDVREKGEWDAGHLEQAILLPLSWLKAERDGEDFARKLSDRLPQKKILYLHCRSGGRVIPAAGILRKAGYEVRPLKSGFEELRKAGFPEAQPEK
ncbi:MAG TPA: rhodanese-like domain-containing protein [Planctomycetota bacterium]|nr:rhodanese-like domain-containing protein [Planctomycetota bacterium]